MRLGVQLRPEHCELGDLRAAWRAADAAGLDSIWTWDHFIPHHGRPDGAHYECWSLLAAMAVETRNAAIGPLVTCTAYRNPHLLADMARTVDLLSGGRLVLGLGAGWYEREHLAYGYPFPPAAERAAAFERAVTAVRERLGLLVPPASGLRLLIGGAGPRTLDAVARHADLWNWYGWSHPDPVTEFTRLSRDLDTRCAAAGRDPGAIERTVMIDVEQVHLAAEFEAAGVEHLIVSLAAPYDLKPLLE
ncbi:LLM class F420-dependent oxidoreductase [Nonomuraea endophytica]|uniref:Putative F420-dependent oxidoreductase n=1 Tax=Nonomuraea endophytica TaxID=714136 RepID=A0A7W8A5T6_9ACTN|nr:LLM class F420-dependent oxidoreductase [Nonomuraea endophytica]MBB5080131.1 putative F420-dependent oxidoreductase [Nonomuraea endophytica]